MVRRAYLTEEFVDQLVAPEQGEAWVSDTAIRGFGVRLWCHNGKLSAAYAIRVTAKDGKPVRRTFDQFAQANFHWRLGGRVVDENGQIKTSALLEDVRAWASTEIKRLKGQLPTLVEEYEVDQEYRSMRRDVGIYLGRKTLGQLVELVLSARRVRGWTEQYSDRLRHAFNAFDPTDAIRSKTMDELSDGSLTGLVEASELSPGNLRLLRSLLNTVLWNVHQMDGPAIGHVFPERRRLQTSFGPSKEEEFTATLARSDINRLLSVVQDLPFNWRARTCIEACLLFWPPASRTVMGRWSHIVDDVWFPYAPTERKHWEYKWDRIDAAHLACLRRARDAARAEGLVSDYWFPSEGSNNRPVANVDRAWFAALDELGWPHLSLAKTARCIRQRWLLWSGLPNHAARQSVRIELAGWGLKVS